MYNDRSFWPRLTDREDEAYKTYKFENKGSTELWHELPWHIQKIYFDKIDGKQTEPLKYEYTSEAMLTSIKRQQDGSDDSFILKDFSEDQLKKVREFVLSFVFQEERNLRQFSKDHQDFMDNYWMEKIKSILE